MKNNNKNVAVSRSRPLIGSASPSKVARSEKTVNTEHVILPIGLDTKAVVTFIGEPTQESIEKLIQLLEIQKDTYPKRAEIEDYLDDGFGNRWSPICGNCGQKTLEIVRPGKVQCTGCG